MQFFERLVELGNLYILECQLVVEDFFRLLVQ